MNKMIVVNEIPTNYLIIDKTNNGHRIIIIMANILFKNFKGKYLRDKSLYLKSKL